MVVHRGTQVGWLEVLYTVQVGQVHPSGAWCSVAWLCGIVKRGVVGWGVVKWVMRDNSGIMGAT